MAVRFVWCLPCKHGVLSLSLKNSHLKKFKTLVHIYSANTRAVETGRSQELAVLMIWGQVKDPVSKYKMRAPKEWLLRLTSGLHMHGFICAQGSTHTRTIKEICQAFPCPPETHLKGRHLIYLATLWAGARRDLLSFKSTIGSQKMARDFQPQKKSGKPTKTPSWWDSGMGPTPLTFQL